MFKKVLCITLLLSNIAHAKTGYNFGNLYRPQKSPKHSSPINYISKKSYQKNNLSFKGFIKQNPGFYADGHAAWRLRLPFAISSTPWYQLTFKYINKKNILEPITIDDTWIFLGPKIGYQGANNWGGELTAFFLFPFGNKTAPTAIPAIITLAGKKVSTYNLYNFKINTYAKIGVSFPTAWILHSKSNPKFSSTTNGFINIGALYQLQSKLSLEGSINFLIPLPPSDQPYINKRNSTFNGNKRNSAKYGRPPSTSKTNIIAWIQLGLTYHFI